jgi:hypothetical protein
MGKVFGILGTVFGAIGFVIGIVNLVMLFTIGWWFLGYIWLFAICGTGIVFSAVGMAKDDKRTLGIAGLALSILGVIIAIVFTVLVIGYIATMTSPTVTYTYYY